MIITTVYSTGYLSLYQRLCKNMILHRHVGIVYWPNSPIYSNSKIKFLVRLHGEFNIFVKLCGNTT